MNLVAMEVIIIMIMTTVPSIRTICLVMIWIMVDDLSEE